MFVGAESLLCVCVCVCVCLCVCVCVCFECTMRFDEEVLMNESVHSVFCGTHIDQ